MSDKEKVTVPGALGKVALPSIFWGGLGLLAFLAVISPNPWIGFLGVAIAAGISLLLWRPGEPQALLFVIGYQWFQGFAPILFALIKGESISQLMGAEQFETATWLTLLAVGVLALGLKCSLSVSRSPDPKLMVDGLRQLSRQRLFLAWVVLCIACSILDRVGMTLPGLKQGLVSFEIWKWAVVLLFFFRWLVSGRGHFMAIVILLVEVFVGMMGYFSSFREVFFIVLLAGTGVFAIGRRRTGTLIGIAAFLLVLFGFWQSIKGSYRQFLSKGERAQVVSVSVKERIDWLSGAVFETSRDELSDGLEVGLGRVGYVEYFGHTLSTVPDRIAHTEGKLWKEAVLHPLMPRLLFPNKPVINDSDRTNAYSGKIVAGADQGTSISIGYVGESYIDFGRWGMFVPIFLWGLLVGKCYDFLRWSAPHPLMGVALGASLLLSTVLMLESSNLKMTGSLISGFLVTAVLIRFFGKAVWGWLVSGKADHSAIPIKSRRQRMSRADIYER